MKPEEFLPLSPAAFQILLALSGQVLHGYGIMKESAGENGEEIPTGTLYRTITKLLKTGLIAESEKPAHVDSEDERRQYYTITPFGTEVLSAEARRMMRLVNEARQKELVPGFNVGIGQGGI